MTCQLRVSVYNVSNHCQQYKCRLFCSETHGHGARQLHQLRRLVSDGHLERTASNKYMATSVLDSVITTVATPAAIFPSSE
jgi:hypothetical protein